MSTGDDKSDEDLLQLILEAEEESFAQGHDLKQRSWSVPSLVMKRLGYLGYVMSGHGSPPVLERIHALHRSLYRPKDFAVGGMHGGIFMFRDVFCRFYIPIGFGRFAIKPLELTDMSPNQLKWLASRPDNLNRYIDQFANVFDFAGGTYGLGDYKQPPKEAKDFFHLAGFQLQAAAATLSVAFDFGGAVQSAILGAELALKGGLVAASENPDTLKDKFGHNKEKAATALATAFPAFDNAGVQAALKLMPHYVENRYSPHQPGRRETGEIAMAAQFVAGEVMRSVCGFSMKSQMKIG